MKINIKATNIELAPALMDYLNKRLEAIEKQVANDSGAHCNIEVGKVTEHHRTGNYFRAEMNLQYRGETIYVESTQADVNTAIDFVRDEVLERLRSEKDKRQHIFRRGALRVKNMIKGLYPWRRNRG